LDECRRYNTSDWFDESKLHTLTQAVRSGNAAVKDSIDSKLNTLTQAINELKLQGDMQEKSLASLKL
jgi:hypothetical protein